MSKMNSVLPQSRAKRGAFAAVAVVSVTAVIALSGCAGMPTGPTVMALPGTGKSFDQFRADDATCQQFASQQTGGVSTQQAAAPGVLGGMAVGTALGAAAGAAFNGRRGAAVGAGAGLLGGSMISAGMAQSSTISLQHRYDQAYVQCMYGNGERVPVQRGAADAYRTHDEATPSPPAYDTPPPPGY